MVDKRKRFEDDPIVQEWLDDPKVRKVYLTDDEEEVVAEFDGVELRIPTEQVEEGIGDLRQKVDRLTLDLHEQAWWAIGN